MFASYKVIPHYILPKKLLTLVCGFFANVKTPFFKNWLISTFIKRYQVNMQEAVHSTAHDYPTFNDFFIRPLKPGLRPIERAAITSPVDGQISEIGPIVKGQLLQAKGKYYSVSSLLGLKDETTAFDSGLFTTIYLSPKDYHRVHMPIEGTLKKMTYIPGQLFSVQPLTTRHIPSLFAINERCVCFFETPKGLMAMVLVGATSVGRMGIQWHGELTRQDKKIDFDDALSNRTIHLKQGDEMGYFKLGSTVILLFAEGKNFAWLESLGAMTPVKLGQALSQPN